MSDLNHFLNSVEASARKILKQQNKRQQESIAHDRAALARAAKHGGRTSPTKVSASTTVSREELKATYTTGGALLIQARPPAPYNETGGPRSPLSPTRHRSEHASDTTDSYLPRIPQSPPQQQQQPPSSIDRPVLPVLTDPRHRHVPSQQQTTDAARKAQRDKRTVDKIVSSPLYKALARSKSVTDHHDGTFGSNNAPSTTQSIRKAVHDVDSINLLLRRLGMRDSSSPTKRPAHAVERRMCLACWAHPDKLTGCEHHAHMGSSSTDLPLELQGPTSWYTDDLYVKYRSEHDRERLWEAYVRLKQEEDERDGRQENETIAVIPMVTRHSLYHTYSRRIEQENLFVQAETRRRNATKSFIFSVNHLWLTNLDHFNQQRKEEHTINDHSLRDRRDEHAIREGYSQIQSISTARALERAVFSNVLETQAISQAGSTTETTIGTLGTPTRRRKRPNTSSFRPPLTLLVCGAWNPQESYEKSSLARVPGVTLIGSDHPSVLWWTYPYQEDPLYEYTRVIALYTRSQQRSSSNAILVLVMLALDAPILSPYWFAWCKGSKAPPPVLYEPSRSLPPPSIYSPCLQSLRASKLQTRLDILLPLTIVLLNSVSTKEDHVFALEEPYGHRRLWPEYTHIDTFRQWFLIPLNAVVQPNYLVDTQQVHVQVALPNATSVGGRFTWHSIDDTSHPLNRLRLPVDYLNLLVHTTPNTTQEAFAFIVSMQHEAMKDVQAAALTSYMARMEERRKKQEYDAKLLEIEQKIELGRLALEAKRAEQVRIEQALQANAAKAADRGMMDRMSEATQLEWERRIQASVVRKEGYGWQLREMTDSSEVVFYYALNEALPLAHRVSWTRPPEWPVEEEEEGGNRTARSTVSTVTETSSDKEEEEDSEEDSEEENELDRQQKKNQLAITQMATALLADEQFLSILKAKLGLSTKEEEGKTQAQTNERVRRRSTLAMDKEEDEVAALDLQDHMMMLTEESDRSRASLMATKLANLHITGQSGKPTPTLPGEGWKRLKASKLPPSFTKAVYSTHTQGPRSSFINQTNHSTPVGMIDPRQSSPYELPEFIPELRALLIPKANADLQERKRQQAEAMGVENTFPIPTKRRRDAIQGYKEGLFERDPMEEDGVTMEQMVEKAVLCARNNNLQGLEALLDDGVDINARDVHGNTLFILVCQQGNKKIAKFLMRRHADINLQNLNGNTALHYLIEYNHMELAEYIKSKGAQDTIQNAVGLTCYEGLSTEHVESL